MTRPQAHRTPVRRRAELLEDVVAGIAALVFVVCLLWLGGTV